jgi:hypothetical protein
MIKARDYTHYDISILVPTRKRLGIFKDTVNSIFELADKSNPNFEVIFKVDFDDHETIDYIKTWTNEWENITFIVNSRKNGYNSLVNHFETMVDVAKGRYMWGFTDDITLITPDWNTLLGNRLTSDFKIYYPVINNHRESLPIYPKKWKEILGYIAPHTGIDVYIQRIMELDGTQEWGKPLNSNYVEYIDEVEVYHPVNFMDETGHDKYHFGGGNSIQVQAREEYYDSPIMLEDKDKIFNYLKS